MRHIPPDFFVADVVSEHNRHIIFATPEMLCLLATATHWYIDGTFKVVKRPFIQLLSIYAFIKRDHAVKQGSLLFVFMSARHKRDYSTVFR